MARYSKTLTPEAAARFVAALEGGARSRRRRRRPGWRCRASIAGASAIRPSPRSGTRRRRRARGRCWSGTRPGGAGRSSRAGGCASPARASRSSSTISPAAATLTAAAEAAGVSTILSTTICAPTPPSPKDSRRRSRSATPARGRGGGADAPAQAKYRLSPDPDAEAIGASFDQCCAAAPVESARRHARAAPRRATAICRMELRRSRSRRSRRG